MARLTQSQTILRLCRLAARVREHPPLVQRAGRKTLAADCFCGQSSPPNECGRRAGREIEQITGLNLDSDVYCFDEEIMDFIEQAVTVALSQGTSPDIFERLLCGLLADGVIRFNRETAEYERC